VSDLHPAELAVTADLASARFRIGVKRGHWREVSYVFPILVIAVAAVEPNGNPSEYAFRFEMTGFPGTAPDVRIWDCATDVLLAVDQRPKGSNRVTEAFKSWGKGTVYRPWDRDGGAHGNWATAYPDLAWNAKRDLTFILEDLYGLLTSNTTAHGIRQAA
jgi:hypothetical protein